MTRKVRSRELARGAGENRRARNSRAEGCIRPITVPICPPSVLSPLIDKFLPLMGDKKEQVSFRALGGYLRLYIIAHKAQ
jgi:hypothetical protein